MIRPFLFCFFSALRSWTSQGLCTGWVHLPDLQTCCLGECFSCRHWQKPLCKSSKLDIPVFPEMFIISQWLLYKLVKMALQNNCFIWWLCFESSVWWFVWKSIGVQGLLCLCQNELSWEKNRPYCFGERCVAWGINLFKYVPVYHKLVITKKQIIHLSDDVLSFTFTQILQFNVLISHTRLGWPLPIAIRRRFVTLSLDFVLFSKGSLSLSLFFLLHSGRPACAESWSLLRP